MEIAFDTAIDRRWFALRYCLWAVAIALATHGLLWGWSTGPRIFFQVQLLLSMVGPALIPPLVAAALIAISARFASMGWVMGITGLVFLLEVGVFLLWYSTVDDELGFGLLWLLPIVGGWPLALVAYLVAGWRKLGL